MTRNTLGRFTKKSLHERIWAKVLKTDTCWLWQAKVDSRGYPGLRIDGKHYRVSHLTIRKERPSKKHVACHKCDTPRCVRPAHLFWGTNKENTQDALSKGRMFIGPKTPVWRRRIGDAIRARLADPIQLTAHVQRVIARNTSKEQIYRIRLAAYRRALAGLVGIQKNKSGKWVMRAGDPTKLTDGIQKEFNTRTAAVEARIAYLKKMYKKVGVPRKADL